MTQIPATPLVYGTDLQASLESSKQHQTDALAYWKQATARTIGVKLDDPTMQGLLDQEAYWHNDWILWTNNIAGVEQLIADKKVADMPPIVLPVVPPLVVSPLGLSAATAGLKIPVGSVGSAFTNPVAVVSGALAGHIGTVTTPILFSGYIAGTDLTVTGSSTLSVGQIISGTGVTTGTHISSLPVAPALTYTVSVTQTVGSISSPVAMTASPSSGLQSLVDTITTTIASIGATMATFVSGLTTSIPLMNAADNISKTLKLAQGILPAAGGGASFAAAFAPMTVVTAHLDALHSIMTSHIEGLSTGDPAAMAAVQAAHDSAAAGATASFASSAASQTDSIGTLKAFAFTKMCAAPQTPQVLAVMNQAMPTMPDSSTVKLDSTLASNAMSATYSPPNVGQGSTTSDNTTATPAPTVDTPPGTVCGMSEPDFRKQYLHVMVTRELDTNTNKEATYAAFLSANTAFEAVRDSLMFSPAYTDVKNAAKGFFSTAAKRDAYAVNKAQLSNTPEFIAYKAAVDVHNTALAEHDRWINQYANWFKAPGGCPVNAICDQTKW